MKVLENVVIESARQFVEEFGSAANVKEGKGIFDLSFYVDINGQSKTVEAMMKGAKRLILLAKANVILQDIDTENQENVEPSVVSMKRKMMPILSKPIMMDMAWHFVDYHDVLETDKVGKMKKTEQDTDPRDQTKKQSSWFG